MCFKKLARVAVGAGVGFLTGGGPLGAVVGGAAAATVKGKSIIGGAALGAAGGFGTTFISGGLSAVTGTIKELAGSTIGKAVLGAAAGSFGQAQQAGTGTGALIAGPVPVGSAVPVSGSAAGGIMTAPVAGIDDEDNVNLGIKMAMNINDSFNRALE